MKKTIELNKTKVDYELKVSKRTRRLKLIVYCDGSLIVTTPNYINQRIIERFIYNKSRWILNKINYFKLSNKFFLEKNSKVDYIMQKDKAYQFIEEKIKQFNKIYNYKFKSINIKKQRTRWGSCSSKGNLNFNYKLTLLPEKIADYIIVHELCHLGEFNHSQKFWDLVAKVLPNYLDIRKELKNVRL